jgi:hypothetical protein
MCRRHRLPHAKLLHRSRPAPAGRRRRVEILFRTHNSQHRHLYVEDQHELMDVLFSDVVVDEAAVPPDGDEIVRLDVVIRLRRKAGSPALHGINARDQSS